MKKILATTVLLSLLAIPGFAQGRHSSRSSKGSTVHVKEYKKKNGKVVKAHDRTAPNSTEYDNWSTKGNVNPETGKKGTKKPKH